MIAVPTANRQKFIEHARQLDPMFTELGAIRVIEGWGDDVPDGKVNDFRRAVQARAKRMIFGGFEQVVEVKALAAGARPPRHAAGHLFR